MKLKSFILMMMLCGFITASEKSQIKSAGYKSGPMMMPYYTGVIMPTPRQATYGDKLYDLSAAGIILGKNLKADDARLKVLTDRIKHYDGCASIAAKDLSSFNTIICIGDTDEAKDLKVPDQPQGYAIKCFQKEGKNYILLKGKDKLGLLWAISSLNQLIHISDGKTVARVAEVFDYPATLNRSVLSGNWGSPEQAVHFFVTFKFNLIVFKSVLVNNHKDRYEWRKERSEKVKNDLKKIGKLLNPLGITWYAGMRTLSWPDPKDQLNCSSEKDFNIVYKMAKTIAEAGGNFSLKFDDIRFPLHADDKAKFGSAKKADLYFINKLYNKLRNEFPGIKMLFCPPFYWGPTSKHTYPESRDEYLREIGKHLPQDVDVFWTGPRVKSTKVTKKDVEWITDRIKRKPFYWQNAFGSPHVHTYHYVVDPISSWRDWFYDGFYNDLLTYTVNGGGPTRAAALISMQDYIWFPRKNYVPERSIELAAKTLTGSESFPFLKKINALLTTLDPYGLRVSPAAAKHSDEISQTVTDLKKTWEETDLVNGKAIDTWTRFNSHDICNAERFLKCLKNNPIMIVYGKNADFSRQKAENEIPLNLKTDTFLSAYDFLGGCGPKFYANKCEKRLATWIYSDKSANHDLKAKFQVEPFPPSFDYQLILSAQDDDLKKKCRIKITVNGKEIFTGPNPFVRHGWSRQTFTIPANILSRYNILTIHSAEKGSNYGQPPYFMLNYAIVRKTEK